MTTPSETTEKVDLKKAVSGPFTGVFWVKTILYGLCFSALVFIGFSVYNVFHPKPNQNIQVGQGGQVVIKNEANKRHLILFCEPYVDANSNGKYGVGIRGGARWEF